MNPLTSHPDNHGIRFAVLEIFLRILEGSVKLVLFLGSLYLLVRFVKWAWTG